MSVNQLRSEYPCACFLVGTPLSWRIVCCGYKAVLNTTQPTDSFDARLWHLNHALHSVRAENPLELGLQPGTGSGGQNSDETPPKQNFSNLAIPVWRAQPWSLHQEIAEAYTKRQLVALHIEVTSNHSAQNQQQSSPRTSLWGAKQSRLDKTS